ncbi:SpoIIE family protein phosphatase [Butyrivibrio sp. YAB3001]|uniref:SpoIIE family protein phosphatase n=1 Tax=Butyrivibrio sp. YAB3001 TaxID=1520812 RepID=UPI0008F661F1|nr:SpoIIE family protein phosphatase [Butyrivibrio sp. YAB3001]SFD05427.1 EamA-like transporter family protein [Butyrivibrio sp. YAB3001]
MIKSKKNLSVLGLILITFLASIQYVFLRNVPEEFSTFAFVAITNTIGLVLLFAVRTKQIIKLQRKTLLKGAFFAVLLTGFNVFTLLGSRAMDSVVVSSVVSLYFVFITPILLILRKKINFFSGVVNVLAVISLILIFGAHIDDISSLSNIVYLIIADICFAAYVVSVSIFGEDEESASLTFAQMCFSVLFSLILWIIETAIGKTTFEIPMSLRFWVSAIFIGIFIRAVYGLVQISCQKHVSAIYASLIFSTEIIMTMMMDPIMCKLLKIEYTPVTVFQIIGGFLLIIATLLMDENIITKLGYDRMDQPSISKKIVLKIISFSVGPLILSALISFIAISSISGVAIKKSNKLGKEASGISYEAMIAELEDSTQRQAHDKAKLAEDKLLGYSRSIKLAASYASSLYAFPNDYPKRHVDFAQEKNAGKWAMQLLLENNKLNISYKKSEIELLGNMEDIFLPIVRNTPDVQTVYIGTEGGIMISYDRDSQLALGEENHYYGYKNAKWYTLGKESKSCVFTDTYWDSYGRGLTITCVSPFYVEGQFAGCVAMDILMNNLNASMVSDGIVIPRVATLLDDSGDVIASGDIDPDAEVTFNIFDQDSDHYLKEIGHEIIENDEGIIKTGEGKDALYVAYASIESTGWKMCIKSPVSTVIEPANEITSRIDKNTEDVVASVSEGMMQVAQSSLVLMAAILVLVIVFIGRSSKKITDPLKQLEVDVRSISDGNLDIRTKVNTDDEIGILAHSFNNMTDSLQKYIADLTEVTAREQRIASELNVATNIQESMLPRDFDEFCSAHNEFELFASMTPAKEVGGDFYDFFMVDEDHLAIVIADVSGKGVPAALFMVRAMTMIRNRALMGGSPGEVLTDANKQLFEGNEGSLFVTVWMAIIEISTGKGIAANAGHEYPAMRRKDENYDLIKYKHSPAIAIIGGIKVKEHEFEIHPGDTLFVYTDGVPEATNKDDELFGKERLVKALNREKEALPRKILANVKEDIDVFVDQAPQFDDLTMLALLWRGKE